MKTSMRVRFFVTALLVGAMLSPISAFAFYDGKGHFNQGLKFEVSEQWDKAAEEFALAVSDNPKNPEYRLHLTRALFNASQMFMKRGTMAAKDNDYEAAYLAFKRAYAFDPTNELAKSEMERMVRLQKDANESANPPKKDNAGGVTLVPTSYTGGSGGGTTQPVPQKLEKLRDLPFANGVDLQFIIKELAKDLDLNVLFDNESFRGGDRKIKIELRNVTAARALDYIFLQEGLFFQKVGPRTIIVANQTQRVKFQQLALRTFYLANAAPKDVAKVVQTAIPAQPGRSQTIVLTDDATNSITVRDTRENIALIGKLISSLDKDRAEVVMDVAIYEVNKTDLLQFGNQIGTQSQLTTLGGTGQAAVGFGSNGNFLNNIIGATTATVFPTAVPAGIILPSANLAAFQSKNNTKLVASTQIHAFNNEDSSARIGQRVPVQSAQFVTAAGTSNGGVVSNVINYEQVGLTLKFKPLVFPNQDVQVAMEIESKDVGPSNTPLVPVFTERTIKGTARIQNNKTLLLASVAQGVEEKGKQGLPLLGLIPIIGRLFTAPTRNNRAVDIVIAVTPRVIRAPNILPEDEIERDTGSLQVPTNNTLEAMIQQEDMDEQLAMARRVPNTAQVQLPDRPAEAPEYVKNETSGAAPVQPAGGQMTSAVKTVMPDNLKPIDSSVKTLQLKQTADTSGAPAEAQPVAVEPKVEAPAPSAPTVSMRFGSDLPEMKAGDKIKVAVMVDGSAAFRSGVVGLKFDDKRVAVRSIAFGDVFGSLADSTATPFINQNGKMYVSLTAAGDAAAKTTGTLAIIEIEALAAGKPEIAFDRDVLNFLTADGKNFVVKF